MTSGFSFSESPARPKKGHHHIRCAAGCGSITRGCHSDAEARKWAVERSSFVKIGKLLYCPRCAAKRLPK